ncbi:CerR family C-terminal domain-containing protein [uncultured Phascolarctobacterium sp.]|uniref:TetR/AcrR family transcriptional regulator n=1 Tax=uncultured Phascolarctobacterium sp. TaxID=512296 RepID=UPI0025DF43F3|nr:CerR family C-terminal domain-containing protein [uncultured Phascolarctobacterium sp.]
MNDNQETQNALSSPDKILQAATRLFAHDDFNSVSIKQIAAASGVNSALISYYFGGKKNLYQEVLYAESDKFLKLQDDIRSHSESPLQKLRSYVDSIAEMQLEQPYNIHLIYRELLSPQPMFENYVKNKLYRIHQFMADLVNDAIACGEIVTAIKPTHVAFTLEGIIMFFFLTKGQIRQIGNFDLRTETDYLLQALDSYLSSLSQK